MKSAEEIMNVLEAYDLTGSHRDAAELAGCSHHTVAHYVALRATGKLTAGQGARRPQLVDEFLPKLEELVDRSHGRIRADVAHRKLAAMGFTGCERTTRRAVAGLKAAWRAGHRRVHRPWVPEPGLFSRGQLANGAPTREFSLCSQADGGTVACATGVVQERPAGSYRCRAGVLSWAMSSRLAARAAARS